MKKTYRIKVTSFKNGLPFRQLPGSVGEIMFKELVYRKALPKKIKSIIQASFLANKGHFFHTKEKEFSIEKIKGLFSTSLPKPRDQQFSIEVDYKLDSDNYFYLEYLFDEVFNNFAIYYPFLEFESQKLYLRILPNLNLDFFFHQFYNPFPQGKGTKNESNINPFGEEREWEGKINKKTEGVIKNLMEFLTKKDSDFSLEVLAHWSIFSGDGFSLNYLSEISPKKSTLDLSNFTYEEQRIIQETLKSKFKVNLKKISSEEHTFSLPFSKIKKYFPQQGNHFKLNERF